MSDSSGGQLLGAVVGGVVGFVATGFNPVGAFKGAAYGYGLGGLVDPPPGPTIKAPRLEDLTVQSSAYGTDLHEVFGTIGKAGNLIYLENGQLREVVTEEEEGKGGGGSTVETVEYFATFAVSLGEVSPSAVVRRIWLGGKLFYNAGSDDIGTIAQSNRNADGFVYYDGTQTEPDPRVEGVVGSENAEAWVGTQYIIFYDLPLADHGNTLQGVPVKVEIVTAPSVVPQLIDETRMPYLGGNFLPQANTLSLERSLVSIPGWDNSYPSEADFDYVEADISNNFTYRHSRRGGGTGVPPNGLNDVFLRPGAGSDLASDVVAQHPFGGYQIRNEVLLWSNSGELNRRKAGVKYTTPGSFTALCLDQQGNSYAANSTSIRKFDETLAEIAFISFPVGHVSAFNQVRLWVDRDRLYLGFNNPVDLIEVFDTNLESPVRTINLPSAPASFSRSEFVVEDGILIRQWLDPTGEIVIDRWNISRVDRAGQPLSDVTSKLVSRSGLEPVYIDTSELSADTVKGYAAGPSDIRGAVGALQSAYLFDLIQDGYNLKAVKRGKPPIATIPMEDLGARFFGDNESDVFVSEREMDTQLPSRLTLEYMDAEREYDPSAQSSTYPTTSRNERNESLAIVLDADEAARLADVLINLSWTERTKFTLRLSRKYIFLKPADIVNVVADGRTYQIRVESRLEESGPVLECSASLANQSLYQSSAKGAQAPTVEQTINYISSANASLIDVPMILESMDSPGYLAYMFGQSSWPGGALFKSSDGGQSYSRIKDFRGRPSVAEAIDVISGHSSFVIDRHSSLSVKVLAGSFPAITEEQMMTGQHWCAYGADGRWELIRYAGAVLESDGTITLSTFVRGAKGTERFTGQHEVGDQVILLSESTTAFLGADISRVGVESLFSAVTRGEVASSVVSFGFTYKAVNLKPIAPVNLKAQKLVTDWHITFDERTRYGTSFWKTGVSRQKEADTKFALDVLNSQGEVVRTMESTTNSFIYTNEFEVLDFGGAVDQLQIRVCQISSRVGRGFTAEGVFQTVQPSVDLVNIPVNPLFVLDPVVGMNDLTANHHVPTNTGVNLADGKALFSGDGGAIGVPHDETLNITDFTIFGWVKPSGTGSYSIVSKGDSTNNFWGVYFDNAFESVAGAGIQTYSDSLSNYEWGGTDLPVGVWSFYCFSISALGEQRLHFNGEAVRTTTGTPAPAISESPITFGLSPFGAAYSFEGEMHLSGMYGRILDDAEVAQLYLETRSAVLGL